MRLRRQGANAALLTADLSQSYYIGDAAGRSSDHSDSDRSA